MSKKAGVEQNNGNSLRVEWWPLGKVKPYSKNPRVRSKSLVEKIARSIEEFGWRQPIVVDESGIIVVGHGRYDAAVMRGWGEVPVHAVSGLSKAQIRAYRIADNKLSEESQWDDDLLALERSEIGDIFTGFDEVMQEINMPELEKLEHESVSRAGEDRKSSIKCVFSMSGDQIAMMERAIAATFTRNRSKALELICRSYLDEKR